MSNAENIVVDNMHNVDKLRQGRSVNIHKKIPSNRYVDSSSITLQWWKRTRESITIDLRRIGRGRSSLHSRGRGFIAGCRICNCRESRGMLSGEGGFGYSSSQGIVYYRELFVLCVSGLFMGMAVVIIECTCGKRKMSLL